MQKKNAQQTIHAYRIPADVEAKLIDAAGPAAAALRGKRQGALRAIPAHIVPVLNRAADTATRLLNAEGVQASRRDLRAAGAAVVVQQEAILAAAGIESQTRHQASGEILHKTLVVEMLTPLDPDLAHAYGFAE
ncbi:MULTISPECIES: hypothetical protein [Burkholderia cepacia complex]|uniref:Uncharacterized protein n=1 Tax=Burkholderia ubonensis TaxID=101571 RepID=A0AB74D6R1_9BURK|nr:MULTISPECIES: hypothetical protein [Burkholderia cepacia complex]PAJ80125.1 hypothetical protein CJO71_15250 [Burkholderia ubonensis]PAJ99659.1 hypothetical protein CJO68_18255 [Burkholderia ubonensis]RQP73245.1 hypothetical protein DF015_25070 [Burkholderia ubonensis]RQP88187.1 hypothetical protein DF012_27910 [Burkholderia ubonensis]RQQ44119.1 hypothetical protein DF145_28185 [Burkholderia stagnalis]